MTTPHDAERLALLARLGMTVDDPNLSNADLEARAEETNASRGVKNETVYGYLSKITGNRLSRLIASIRGADVVAGRSSWTGYFGASNGTNTYGNYRSVHTVAVSAADLRLVYTASWAHESVSLGNSIIVTAAIETPVVGGTAAQIYQVTFGGKTQVTIDAPNGIAISDPLGVSVPAGSVIAVRTFVTPATNVGSGGKWPVSDPPTYGLLGVTTYNEAGLAATGATADQTLSFPYFTANNSSSATMYKPVAILGVPSVVSPLALGGWGDSIMAGVGDYVGNTSDTFPMCGKGYLRRAINDQYPLLNLGMPGETAKQTSTDGNRLVRGALLTGCSHVFYNLGINDLKTDGASLAQLQSYILAACTYLVNKGVVGLNGRSGVIVSTLVPNTTTTDGWGSTGGQTVTAFEPKRLGINQWLRAGAPIDPVSFAAVAIGTASALLAGNINHPILTVQDLCSMVETAQDSGLWTPAQRKITDGGITATAAVLTSATANFTNADKGLNVAIMGAGAAGAVFEAQIASVTNSTTVSLNASASTTVVGASVGIGTYTYDGTHPSSLGHLAMAAHPSWVNAIALAALLA